MLWRVGSIRYDDGERHTGLAARPPEREPAACPRPCLGVRHASRARGRIERLQEILLVAAQCDKTVSLSLKKKEEEEKSHYHHHHREHRAQSLCDQMQHNPGRSSSQNTKWSSCAGWRRGGRTIGDGGARICAGSRDCRFRTKAIRNSLPA